MAGMNTNGFLNHYDYDPESIASKLVVALFILDVILGSLIYIAGLKSKRRLLHFYYCYSVGLCLLTILVAGVSIGLTARGWFTLDSSEQNLIIPSMNYMGCFVIMGLQVYFVLLLRREMMNRKELTNKRPLVREIEFVTEAEYPVQLNNEAEQNQKVYLLKWEKDCLNQIQEDLLKKEDFISVK